MKKVLVPLAEGCEEMEAVTIIDVLRRAGLTVETVGLTSGVVTASRGVRLLPDREWPDSIPGPYVAIVLPGGGPGTERLQADPRVLEAVRAIAAAGGVVAAICAAPQVLYRAGVLRGKRFTCYPGVERVIEGGVHVERDVEVDGRVITSRGPGTSIAFALTVVAALTDVATAGRVADGLLTRDRAER